MNVSHHHLENLEHRFHSIEQELRLIVVFVSAQYPRRRI